MFALLYGLNIPRFTWFGNTQRDVLNIIPGIGKMRAMQMEVVLA